jgi:hypothetical protein
MLPIERRSSEIFHVFEQLLCSVDVPLDAIQNGYQACRGMIKPFRPIRIDFRIDCPDGIVRD